MGAQLHKGLNGKWIISGWGVYAEFDTEEAAKAAHPALSRKSLEKVGVFQLVAGMLASFRY